MEDETIVRVNVTKLVNSEGYADTIEVKINHGLVEIPGIGTLPPDSTMAFGEALLQAARVARHTSTQMFKRGT